MKRTRAALLFLAAVSLLLTTGVGAAAEEPAPASQLALAERIACILGDPHYGTPLAGVAMGMPPLPDYGATTVALPPASAAVGALGTADSDDVDVAVALAASLESAASAVAAPAPAAPPLPFPPGVLTDAGARHAYLSSLGLRAGSGVLRALLQRRIVDRIFCTAVGALVVAAAQQPLLLSHLFRTPPLDPR